MIPFTSTLLEELGPQLGIQVELEPRFRQVGTLIFKNGRRSYFKLSSLDVNPNGAAKIATDKDYASYFLRRLGYNVPEGEAFFSDAWCQANGTSNNRDAALAYASKVGFPVIVKPNSKAQGNGVTKVYDLDSLVATLESLFLIDDIILVQKPVKGRDYRFIVYKDSVPIVYERKQFAVTGDGRKNVRELTTEQFADLARRNRHIRVKPNDARIIARLKHVYGADMEYVPDAGVTIQLLDNANMSSGGEAVDISKSVHPSYKTYVAKITMDMGLSLCGVDLMTEDDLSKPIGHNTIIEINDHPGLEHYTELGNAATARVRELYVRILEDLCTRYGEKSIS